MRKSERLNDMLRFLNNKKYFNLRDLMDEYHISKSTALRDISSLAELGMPIYAEHGKYGRYEVLPNRLLSPILFTLDEIYSLYFSMRTLDAYQSTPFHLSVEKLKEKFEACLSKEQIAKISQLGKLLKLESYRHPNSSPLLKEILRVALEEKICDVVYLKKGSRQTYIIQFFNISAIYGQWYATGYNFLNNRVQVFRCDKITDIIEISDSKYQPRSLAELTAYSNSMYKQAGALDFAVGIADAALDRYFKEHYPSMSLVEGQAGYVIQGFYNPGEEDFIASYFLSYGTALTSIHPPALKALIVEKVNEISNALHNVSPA